MPDDAYPSFLLLGNFLHTTSRWIVDDLVAHGIGMLVIDKNDGWKQEANMGKRTNQNFVSIPHARFIQMIQYKAELAGIAVLVTEESCTSKASFLDRDEMPVYNPNRKEKPQFSDKRIERGLYRAADGTLINADCNGSYMPGLSRPLTYSCGNMYSFVVPTRLIK